jgi:glycosyltransferase family protein
MRYPKVLTEIQTVGLLHQGKSIARYGDGEIKLALGSKCVSQEYSPTLANRLIDILKSNSKKCLIGIPKLDPIERIAEGKKREFWSRYTSGVNIKFYDPDKVYASSFITRPDNVPMLDEKGYYDFIKKVWEGRDVVLVNGDDSKSKFDKDEEFLDNVKSLKRLLVPHQHAWRDYSSILYECSKQPMDSLYILAVGPTATVLAYDLSETGRQALDMGHLGRIYAKFKEDNQ